MCGAVVHGTASQKCVSEDIYVNVKLNLYRDTALKIIIQRSSTPDGTDHRLVWSPHVPLPEGEEDEEEVCNIVLTHGCNVSPVISSLLAPVYCSSAGKAN